MIEVHGYEPFGSIDATIDGARMSVPDDMKNCHRRMIAEWEAEGNVIAPYEAPPPTFPLLSPRQVRLMMLQIGLSPADIEAQITAIPDPDERAAALIEWDWATQYERDHPLVASLASALEFTEAELDTMWLYAAEL